MKRAHPSADRLPIEPLPEASWERLERALFEELDDRARFAPGPTDRGRARWPRWAFATAFAIVALQIAAVLLLLREPRAATQLSGVRFESHGQASERTLGDIALALEPHTALVVVEDGARGSLCVLEQGAVRFGVPRRGARPPFVVRAGSARVEVVGTRFRVERVGKSARVTTYEGTVRVNSEGEETLVQRGQTWPRSRAPKAAGAEVDSAATKAPALDGAAPRPAPDPRRARYERATALEARDPEQALTMYRALGAQEDAWAQNALYAEGRLLLELGRKAEASRALRRYRQRYPNGANAADARALLQRLHR